MPKQRDVNCFVFFKNGGGMIFFTDVWQATDKALATIPVLCSNQLPIQFRLKWHSTKAFEVFLEWWWSVKAESLQARGHQLSQEQLTLVVGCFLCPT